MHAMPIKIEPIEYMTSVQKQDILSRSVQL
jgi:hypothetical protein